MGHPLSDQQRAEIKESWSSVQKFGLQEAGIVMFKRLCILSACLSCYDVPGVLMYVCVCTCVSVC